MSVDRATIIAASVQRIDATVPTYVTQFAELVDLVGKGEAYAEFNRRLLSLPADAVAALATGALAKLSEQADNSPTSAKVVPLRPREGGQDQ